VDDKIIIMSEFSLMTDYIFEVEDIIFKTDLGENRFTRYNSIWGFTLESVLDAIESIDALN
jgi:hypothetical protein